MQVDLYNGDCLEIMKDIPDKSVDLILCDLPYGTTASEWDKVIPANLLWEQYNRILSPNGSVLLFASGLFTPQVMLSNISAYKYKYVWIKNTATNFVHAKNRPMTKHEDILVFSNAPMGHVSLLGDKRMLYNPQGLIPIHKEKKASPNRFGTIAGKRKSHVTQYTQTYTNYPDDVLSNFPETLSSKKTHPNEKPVTLLEYLIKTYTNEGDTVLDNCMGSGSTGVACVNTGRNFIGMELDDQYFKIAQERINKAKSAWLDNLLGGVEC